MKVNFNFWILPFVFLQISVLKAQPPAFDTLSKIDKIFSGWNESTPGGVLQITREGKTIYRKAFGMADLEHNAKNITGTGHCS